MQSKHYPKSTDNVSVGRRHRNYRTKWGTVLPYGDFCGRIKGCGRAQVGPRRQCNPVKSNQMINTRKGTLVHTKKVMSIKIKQLPTSSDRSICREVNSKGHKPRWKWCSQVIFGLRWAGCAGVGDGPDCVEWQTRTYNAPTL